MLGKERLHDIPTELLSASPAAPAHVGVRRPPPTMSREHVGGVGATIEKIWSFLSLRLVTGVARARMLASMPACGHVYLTGCRGQGKTTVASVIATMLSRYTMSLSHVVWIDCRGLLGRSPKDITTSLESAWREAASRTPSILVLDDLDVLMPSEVEGGGGGDKYCGLRPI